LKGLFDMKLSFYMTLAASALMLSACSSPSSRTTADSIDRNQQEAITTNLAKTVPIPNITQGTTRRTIAMVLAAQDKALPTYSYHYNAMKGCYVPFAGVATTFGYPIPGATQMTNPLKAEYHSSTGYAVLANADPDGTFKPAAEAATYVLMRNPDNGNLEAQYSEPDLVTLTFKARNICQ
jgi:hypothetical protein